MARKTMTQVEAFLAARVGRRVASLRGGRSQQELAEALEVEGCVLDRTSVGRLENGHRLPRLDELLALASALDVAPISLVFPPDDPDEVVLTARHRVPPGLGRAWFRGQEHLPGQDRRVFQYETGDYWIDAQTARRQKALLGLVDQLSRADEGRNKAEAIALLDALAAEVERQRGAWTAGEID